MNRREIFARTVNHLPCDEVLVDFGGCPLSGVASDAILDKLKHYLGYEGKSDRQFDERLLRHYDVDTRGVGFILMPPAPHYQMIEEGNLYRDEWGIVRRFTGLYWDIVENPLADKSYEEIERYPFPDPDSLPADVLDATVAQARHYYEDTDYIVVGSHPVYGVFELACWMFGFEDFLCRMIAEPETVHLFFNRVLAYQREISDFYYGKIGKYLHITTSGDDFATQNSTFCSESMFRELIAPYLKERIAFTKAKTNARFLHHSCGDVYPLVDALIDCGVDILNPIQPCAADMQPASLIQTYGGRIVFHGGLDTQQILPRCSETEIGAEVKNLIDAMSGGDYIFAAAHNLQDDVPVAHIDALLDAARRYKHRKNRIIAKTQCLPCDQS